jgi:hypothetical protein
MQGIEIPIGAPLGQLDKDLKNATNKISNFADTTLGKFAILNKTKFTFGQNFISEADKLASKGKGLGDNLSGPLVKGSNQAAFALQNLGRVAQDAPFGFIGIQNNLNPLLESFQRLKAESGSTGGALKALTSSLTGAGGIGLALSVVTAAFTFAQMGLRAWGVTASKTKDEIDETTKSFKDQRDEFLKSPYEKAVSGLSELRSKISLAKQGFLDKKSVLKEYNEGIGATIGKVNDLNAAEQALINNGDKYLQLMLLKAKAEFAFKKAAEQSYEIIKKQNEIEVNKNPLGFDKKALVELQKLGKQPITALSLQTQFDEETELKKLNNFANRAINIAKNAEQEVIDFAKKSGFNLNSLFDIDADKSNKDVKTVADILAQLDIDLKKVSNSVDITFGQGNKDKVKAFATAIDSLTEIKAGGGIIKNIQNELLNTKNVEVSAKTLGVNAATAFGVGFAAATTSIKGITFKSKFDLLNQELIAFNKSASEIVNNSLIQTFAGIGNAIGDSLANGTSLAQNLGASLLSSLSSVLSQLGQLAIGTAFAIEGIKTSLKSLNPGPALVAGIALIALAGGVRALGKKMGGGGGSAGNSGGSGLVPTPKSSASISTSAAGSAQDFGGGRVVFEISGTNLVGVLNRAGAKLQRFG